MFARGAEWLYIFVEGEYILVGLVLGVEVAPVAAVVAAHVGCQVDAEREDTGRGNLNAVGFELTGDPGEDAEELGERGHAESEEDEEQSVDGFCQCFSDDEEEDESDYDVDEDHFAELVYLSLFSSGVSDCKRGTSLYFRVCLGGAFAFSNLHKNRSLRLIRLAERTIGAPLRITHVLARPWKMTLALSWTDWKRQARSNGWRPGRHDTGWLL